MKLIRHPNVIRMYEVMVSKTKIYIVLEFVTGGELFDKIATKGRLKEDEARKYFLQLINAVDYCHSRGVFHRDLKPENLLLDASECLKVSDFGLSALPQQVREDGLLHTTCGTPNYVAPEVINNNGYDGAKADLWSCGVILFVLMAGYLPFEESNLLALYKKQCNLSVWEQIFTSIHNDADKILKIIGEAYAVLSDSYKEAKDCRLFGPVSMNDIIGRVLYCLRTSVDHDPIQNSQFSMQKDLPMLEVELDVDEMAKNHKA